jgi:hypothetical protein
LVNKLAFFQFGFLDAGFGLFTGGQLDGMPRSDHPLRGSVECGTKRFAKERGPRLRSGSPDTKRLYIIPDVGLQETFLGQADFLRASGSDWRFVCAVSHFTQENSFDSFLHSVFLL